jgi:hypothetical protein
MEIWCRGLYHNTGMQSKWFACADVKVFSLCNVNDDDHPHVCSPLLIYECVSRSFRTDRLERELQMIQLSATRCSFIAIL